MILVGRHPLQSFFTSGLRETQAELGTLAILHTLRYILMGYELKTAVLMHTDHGDAKIKIILP